jgi:hypothetical protein
MTKLSSHQKRLIREELVAMLRESDLTQGLQDEFCGEDGSYPEEMFEYMRDCIQRVCRGFNVES